VVTAGTRRPNIVFIFADDWGWGDLGCYGHPYARTPNLDRLASQGILFTQFNVCSGVCSPSRTAVMTGRFPARFGIHGHFAEHDVNAKRGMPNWLDPAVPTVTRCLQENGYAVGHYGKWHLGHGEGAPEPFAYGIDECRVNVGNGPQLDFGPEGRGRSSEVIVDETIGFIDRHADEPFFVQAWLNDTHAILDPGEESMAEYERFTADGMDARHRGALRVYFATVTNADRQIGRLLDHLDARGLSENTIVVFSSDNGPEDIVIRNASHSGVGSSGPFRGRKRSLYEGGVRTPFILRRPGGGTPAGVIDNDTVLSAVDLMPTFCALTGSALPEHAALDGEDMSAAFLGKRPTRTKPLFWEWRFRVHGHVINASPMLAVRSGDWKLLLNPDRSRVELYDVPNDAMELENLADRHPEVVEELAGLVLAWQAELPEGPLDPGAGSNWYPWPGRSHRGPIARHCTETAPKPSHRKPPTMP
jgi:N-acetylgalactosamine-6-sulfatase